jgi:hypothetical protein
MKLIDAVLNNVTRYDDFEDFSCYHDDITREEWQEYCDDGWAGEITPGTYNGATKKFTRVSKLTDDDIINAIKSDIADDEFIDISLQEFYPNKPNTPDVQALVYTEAYEVFTIGERLFADKG